MHDTHQTFHIGVNVFVVKDSQLLLGKRKNSYGAGTWGLPGGHLETGEAMKDAAQRELKEETGLEAKNFEFANIVNDRSHGQHYIHVGFIAQEVSGNPAVKEPDRFEEWKWFGFDKLPDEVFPGHIEQIKLFFKDLRFIDG